MSYGVKRSGTRVVIRLALGADGGVWKIGVGTLRIIGRRDLNHRILLELTISRDHVHVSYA